MLDREENALQGAYSSMLRQRDELQTENAMLREQLAVAMSALAEMQIWHQGEKSCVIHMNDAQCNCHVKVAREALAKIGDKTVG